MSFRQLEIDLTYRILAIGEAMAIPRADDENCILFQPYFLAVYFVQAGRENIGDLPEFVVVIDGIIVVYVEIAAVIVVDVGR